MHEDTCVPPFQSSYDGTSGLQALQHLECFHDWSATALVVLAPLARPLDTLLHMVNQFACSAVPETRFACWCLRHVVPLRDRLYSDVWHVCYVDTVAAQLLQGYTAEWHAVLASFEQTFCRAMVWELHAVASRFQCSIKQRTCEDLLSFLLQLSHLYSMRLCDGVPGEGVAVHRLLHSMAQGSLALSCVAADLLRSLAGHPYTFRRSYAALDAYAYMQDVGVVGWFCNHADVVPVSATEPAAVAVVGTPAPALASTPSQLTGRGGVLVSDSASVDGLAVLSASALDSCASIPCADVAADVLPVLACVDAVGASADDCYISSKPQFTVVPYGCAETQSAIWAMPLCPPGSAIYFWLVDCWARPALGWVSAALFTCVLMSLVVAEPLQHPGLQVQRQYGRELMLAFELVRRLQGVVYCLVCSCQAMAFCQLAVCSVVLRQAALQSLCEY